MVSTGHSSSSAEQATVKIMLCALSGMTVSYQKLGSAFAYSVCCKNAIGTSGK